MKFFRRKKIKSLNKRIEELFPGTKKLEKTPPANSFSDIYEEFRKNYNCRIKIEFDGVNNDRVAISFWDKDFHKQITTKTKIIEREMFYKLFNDRPENLFKEQIKLEADIKEKEKEKEKSHRRRAALITALGLTLSIISYEEINNPNSPLNSFINVPNIFRELASQLGIEIEPEEVVQVDDSINESGFEHYGTNPTNNGDYGLQVVGDGYVNERVNSYGNSTISANESINPSKDYVIKDVKEYKEAVNTTHKITVFYFNNNNPNEWGDSALIESEDSDGIKHYLLQDMYKGTAVTHIINKLTDKNIKADAYVSHYHSDHAMKMVEFIESDAMNDKLYLPRPKYLEKYKNESGKIRQSYEMYESLLDAVKKVNKDREKQGKKQIDIIYLDEGLEFNVGTAKCKVIWAGHYDEMDMHSLEGKKNSATQADHYINNQSVVLLIDFGDVTYITAGDIEKETEKNMIKAGIVPNVTIDKGRHHGGKGSNTEEFLKALAPEIAYINFLGGTKGWVANTVKILQEEGANVYSVVGNTNPEKDLTFTITGNHIEVDGANLTHKTIDGQEVNVNANMKVHPVNISKREIQTTREYTSVDIGPSDGYPEEIVEQIMKHNKDFNSDNYEEKMAEYGGAINYWKSLGGIFAEYAGIDNVPIETDKDFQRFALYYAAVHDIVGPDYCVGGESKKVRDRYKPWYDAESRFYKKNVYTWTNAPINEKILKCKWNTNCNGGLDSFLRSTNLTNGKSKATHYKNLLPGEKYINKKEDLQVGDIVHFFKKKNGNWSHVAIVGEIYGDKIILYDFGSRFVNEGGTRKRMDTVLGKENLIMLIIILIIMVHGKQLEFLN